jgi:phosphomevalonate kinase
MDLVESSAPGKLVFLGAYSALFGAPAIVAAVDRRALVRLEASAGGEWEVSAPGLAPGSAAFEVGEGGAVRWRDEAIGRRYFAMVEKIVQGVEAGRAELGVAGPFAATLDTRSFFEAKDGGPAKLGLGSSAALTVALASAVGAWAARGRFDASDAQLRSLVDLHRAVQGGAGSGIDVAASLLGGVVRYRLDEDGSVAEAAPTGLPENLRMLFVWTGRSASTGDFLERLELRLGESPDEVRPALDALGASAAGGVAAIAEGSATSFLSAVDAFWEGLDRLGGALAMPILSDEHRVLRQLAVECGVHYKPSGAGGGDLGIGFTTDGEALSRMADAAAVEGFRIVDLEIDPKGLVVSKA